MPLLIGDDTAALDPSRLAFRERLRTGRVVPIVSNRAIFNRMLGLPGTPEYQDDAIWLTKVTV